MVWSFACGWCSACAGGFVEVKRLTRDQVRELVVRANGGESFRSLSADYGVSYQCVLNVYHGRSRKGDTGDIERSRSSVGVVSGASGEASGGVGGVLSRDWRRHVDGHTFLIRRGVSLCDVEPVVGAGEVDWLRKGGYLGGAVEGGGFRVPEPMPVNVETIGGMFKGAGEVGDG